MLVTLAKTKACFKNLVINLNNKQSFLVVGKCRPPRASLRFSDSVVPLQAY